VLKDPYTLEEIENFEKSFTGEFKIEKSFRKYLLEISKEIIIGSYIPIVFELDRENCRTVGKTWGGRTPEEERYQIAEGGCAFSSEIDLTTGYVYEIDYSEGTHEIWGVSSFKKKFDYYINHLKKTIE
jgi:hypothetical protein